MATKKLGLGKMLFAKPLKVSIRGKKFVTLPVSCALIMDKEDKGSISVSFGDGKTVTEAYKASLPPESGETE